MKHDFIQGDAWGTYVALARSAPPERGMAYRTRGPWSRSPRSSLGWGKPTTWRRGTGRRHGKGGRVRDAQEPEPQYRSSTGELIDIERVTISSEGGRWKSTHRGNSLAAYPTSRAVLRGLSGSNPARLPGGVRATGSSTSSRLLPLTLAAVCQLIG